MTRRKQPPAAPAPEPKKKPGENLRTRKRAAPGESVPQIRDANGLTISEERFAQGVAGGLRYYVAYNQAYPASKEWTREATYVAASRLMALPKVRARVDAIRAEVAARAVLEQATIEREIDLVAMVDIGDLFDDEGCLLAPHQMPAHIRRAVKKFEVESDGTIKVELHSKLEALNMGAKIRGLYEADNKQKAPVMPSRIELVPLQPINHDQESQA